MTTVESLCLDDDLLMTYARWEGTSRGSEVYLRDAVNHQCLRLGELGLLNGN